MTETTMALTQAIVAAPAGTAGLVIEPWGDGEVLGVAADWTVGAAMVHAYEDGRWRATFGRVGDFCHSMFGALDWRLCNAMFARGDMVVEDEVDALVDSATCFGDRRARYPSFAD